MIQVFRRSAYGLTLAAGLLLVGCASGPAGRSALPQNYPATKEDWNGNTVDQVEFLKPFTLNSYSAVVVEPLDTSSTALPDKDDNTHQSAREALAKVTPVFTQGVTQTLGPWATVRSGSAGAGTLSLRCAVVEINPGSRAARYFVGYGAGASRTTVRGELVDPATNTVLLRFTHAKASGTGFFGGSYEDFIRDDITDVGKDIGTLIGAHFDPALQPQPKPQ